MRRPLAREESCPRRRMQTGKDHAAATGRLIPAPAADAGGTGRTDSAARLPTNGAFSPGSHLVRTHGCLLGSIELACRTRYSRDGSRRRPFHGKRITGACRRDSRPGDGSIWIATINQYVIRPVPTKRALSARRRPPPPFPPLADRRRQRLSRAFRVLISPSFAGR